jgi:peptidoglycan hydrolase CwlO-like protein
MQRLGFLAVPAILLGIHAAAAQDISGIEDCTKTSGLDKRTGCFQSNIDYLKQLMTRTTGDLQQKLGLANAELGELKRATAALRSDIGALQANITKLQSTIEQLQQCAKKSEGKDSK